MLISPKGKNQKIRAMFFSDPGNVMSRKSPMLRAGTEATSTPQAPGSHQTPGTRPWGIGKQEPGVHILSPSGSSIMPWLVKQLHPRAHYLLLVTLKMFIPCEVGLPALAPCKTRALTPVFSLLSHMKFCLAVGHTWVYSGVAPGGAKNWTQTFCMQGKHWPLSYFWSPVFKWILAELL